MRERERDTHTYMQRYADCPHVKALAKLDRYDLGAEAALAYGTCVCVSLSL